MYSSEMTMTIKEWIGIQPNPIQRDTEYRARKAINGHLKQPSETHRRVAMAMLPDGERFKLDGHTRALLWSDKRLAAPDTVKVDIYHVDNMSDVEDLYKQFDNADAVETASDRLMGAFRLHKFSPSSLLVRKGGLTSALAVLTKKVGARMNIYQEITPWMPSIRLIDSAGFSNQEFPTGVFAAALLTVHGYGESALEFWRRYEADEGIKEGKIRCPVQTLRDLVRDKRLTKNMTGQANNIEITEKAISCYEAHRAGQMYTTGAKATDLDKYMERIMGKQQRAA